MTHHYYTHPLLQAGSILVFSIQNILLRQHNIQSTGMTCNVLKLNVKLNTKKRTGRKNFTVRINIIFSICWNGTLKSLMIVYSDI